jgi:hypothetical protein
VTRIIEQQEVVWSAVAEKARQTISERQKIFVYTELDSIEIAALTIVENAAQCGHIVDRRIQSRQARADKLRYPDQKGVPGHISRSASRGGGAPSTPFRTVRSRSPPRVDARHARTSFQYIAHPLAFLSRTKLTPILPRNAPTRKATSTVHNWTDEQYRSAMKILPDQNRQPASTSEVLLVHSSDIHVDDSRGTAGLQAVLATAGAVGAHLVLLAGDTFENNQLSASVLGRAAELLAGGGCPL